MPSDGCWIDTLGPDEAGGPDDCAAAGAGADGAGLEGADDELPDEELELELGAELEGAAEAAAGVDGAGAGGAAVVAGCCGFLAGGRGLWRTGARWTGVVTGADATVFATGAACFFDPPEMSATATAAATPAVASAAAIAPIARRPGRRCFVAGSVMGIAD